MLRNRIAISLILTLLCTCTIPVCIAAEEQGAPRSEELEYIVKWINSPLSGDEDYEILSHDKELKVTLIRVAAQSANEVIERLRQDPNIKYIESNTILTIDAKADPLTNENQYYLDQTRTRLARDIFPPNPDLTVAVLDTGIDLTHPDLVDNLVDGFNLVESRKSPQDDNGHGTMIAGVLGATGSNPIGITGVLKQARIMPIKVMDENGSGDSATLSKGIRLAVDEGADIILLSLGDPIYSALMQEMVEYAEGKGVLVVSATGNETGYVNYPAAFPTVLSVGATNQQDRIASYSNRGPEVDVAAPGDNIYTTTLGGKYGTSTGTSMAAPQVAGLAALILARYPDLTPAQVRNLLRSTAIDIETPGWDKKAGYGRIDAIRALSMALPKDIYEPNDITTQVKVAPLGRTVDASFSSVQDKDWYKIEVENKGSVRIGITNLPSTNTAIMKTTLYNSRFEQLRSISSNRNLSFEEKVDTGTYYLKMEVTGSVNSNAGLPYSINTRFKIYDDPYMNNNSADRAAKIALEGKSLTGTFSQDYDEDWFEFAIPLEGEFSFIVTPDSLRIDPKVTVIKPDGKRLTYDEGNVQSGELKYNLEQGSFRVTEGKLRIGVRNFYNYAANAEYTIEWNYKPDIIDKYEPNNSLFSAKTVKLGDPIYGFIASIADYDYYKFVVEEEGLFQLAGSNFPLTVRPALTLYNQKYERMATVDVASNASSFTHQRWLTKGNYFVRIDAKSKFADQLYKLVIQKQAAAFKDIIGNWAQQSINHLTGLGVINGYEDKTFQPNRVISRGEFVNLIVKSLSIPKSNVEAPFKDVKSSYWAYNSINAAYQRGIVTGYKDGTFRPDAPISRAEMVAFLARGLSYKPVKDSDKVTPSTFLVMERFTDINKRAWYTDDLSILLKLELIKGFEDGTFRPLTKTSRAEVASMLERIWYSK